MAEASNSKKVFYTDAAQIPGAEDVDGVYAFRSNFMDRFPAHTAVILIAKNNIYTAQGIGEVELRIQEFQRAMWLAVAQNFGIVSQGYIGDFKRLRSAITKNQELEYRADPNRTPEEDAKPLVRDRVNYHELIQGQGRAGLKERSNIEIKLIEDDPEKIRRFLYPATKEITELVDNMELAYSLPNLNSHTVPALIMERADELAKAKGVETHYLRDYADKMRGRILLPGASTSFFARGPNLAKLRNPDWVKAHSWDPHNTWPKFRQDQIIHYAEPQP